MVAGRKIGVYADQGILLRFFYFHCTDLSIKEILKQGRRPKTEFNALIFKE
jgi:hypothetical protein